MFTGTGSDVGKSLLVAGLCRAYQRRGLQVRPFKPQNMSNNAAVTVDGGEIGRAQALQALACGVEPHSDMNPILLKPQTDIGSQVVIQGQVWGNAKAREYQTLKPSLLPHVLTSFKRLSQHADFILVEGAGSIAEVNLRAGDIANMGFAEAAQVPVIVIGDIDRGGVIASLVGTHVLLSTAERKLLAGFIINKFRGDVSLFDDGLHIIEERTGWRSFGVIPYFAAAKHLPAEDAFSLSQRNSKTAAAIKIIVPRLSRIANFDDFDPLLAEPDVELQFIEPGHALPGNADLIILPGSKATIADLHDLREQGWDIDIQAHLRRGGHLLGLCGGYQMLGKTISDPEGIEGEATTTTGLDLLDLNTALTGGKTLTRVNGIALNNQQKVMGYEIHIGKTTGPALQRPLLDLAGHPDGAISADGKIMGCYLHGLFSSDNFRHAFLDNIRQRRVSGIAYDALVDNTLNELATHLEEHMPLDELLLSAASI